MPIGGLLGPRKRLQLHVIRETKPGDYSIAMTQRDFQTYRIQRFRLGARQSLRINAVPRVGPRAAYTGERHPGSSEIPRSAKIAGRDQVF